MKRPFAPEWILISLQKILPYFGVTLAVAVLTVLLGLTISILLVRAKFSKKRVFVLLSDFFIHILRCTPSIVLLFIVFYGIPKIALVLFGVNINFWPKIIFVVIALSLLYSAQLAEIIRSAYLAVGKEQYEAAVSIGLTPFQAVFRIVLPQAFVYALPNFGNSLIALLKEGSLAYTIGLIDIMGAGNLIISRNYGAFALETYIALSVLYWGMTVLIEQIFKRLELHFAKGNANAA